MERDEAKHILELCRPGSDDDRDDPIIAEAMSMLETDSELREWFADQQAVDKRISAAFTKLEPPADLKTSILVGMRVHARKSDKGSRQATFVPGTREPMDAPTRSRSWWRNPWTGIAAVFAVLLALSLIPERQSAQFAGTSEATLTAGVPDMIQFLARELNKPGSHRSFDKASNDPSTLQAYLASVGAPSPAKLPRQLEKNPSLGCFTFDYNGVRMGMICFKNDQVVHLITVRKSDCPRSFQPERPTLYQVEDQAFKAWTEGDQVYILSTKGSKEKLPQVI